MDDTADQRLGATRLTARCQWSCVPGWLGRGLAFRLVEIEWAVAPVEQLESFPCGAATTAHSPISIANGSVTTHRRGDESLDGSADVLDQ